MQTGSVAALPQAPWATRPRRGQAPARGAPRSRVVAAVASMPKSSSPLLEGLVAEGIITADEAASCSPEQLEFLIRKRFRPESSPERASIQAYVTDGVITEQELENCTPEQLEFLIRKRSPGPAGASSGDGGAANVVPWSSPGKDKAQQRSASESAAGGSSNGDNYDGIEAFIANGILTQEEVEKCSPQQLEFLIRKRSPSPPARGAARAQRAAPAPPKPKAAPPQEPQLPAKEDGFVQLSLEEYLAQGIVSESEIEQCSPEQLSFLIRKRVTLAAKAAAAPPPSPSRGRSRGPVRNPPAAAVQASAASSSAPAVEEPPRKLVVPRAPPLTDNQDASRLSSRSPSPVMRPMVAQASQSGGSLWAGLAAAGLTVVGLSAGLYFAGRDELPAPSEPSAKQQPAPAKADAVKLADKPEPAAKPAPKPPAAAAKLEAPKPAPPAPAPPPPAKVESRKEAPPAPPKVEEKKPAPAPPAPAASKPESRPLLSNPWAHQKEEAKPVAPVADKTASKRLAQQLAAELAAELAEKQAPEAPAPAKKTAGKSGELSRSQAGAGATLAAAGAVLTALLVPSAREAIFSRFAGEAAVLKSAGARYASLQKLVEAQQGDLRLLQDQLSVAQTEYGQALAKLNSARGALESLGSRVQSSEKAAKALVADLERLPSKEAQRLRSEAAAVANSVAAQRAAVDRALQRALKDL